MRADVHAVALEPPIRIFQGFDCPSTSARGAGTDAKHHVGSCPVVHAALQAVTSSGARATERYEHGEQAPRYIANGSDAVRAYHRRAAHQQSPACMRPNPEVSNLCDSAGEVRRATTRTAQLRMYAQNCFTL
jgi:hypothetical protein